MKKVILITAFMAFVCISCSSDKDESNNQKPNSGQTLSDPDTLKIPLSVESLKSGLPTSGEGFKKIVDYLEKHANHHCYEFNLRDNDCNFYQVFAAKHDYEGDNLAYGPEHYTTLCICKDGIKDRKHFFMYNISRGKVSLLNIESDSTGKFAKTPGQATKHS